jgi:hypothetical protein
MFEKVLFWLVMLLIAGPLIMVCIPAGRWRDKLTAAWGKSYMVVFYFGCAAGLIMFLVLLLEKLTD